MMNKGLELSGPELQPNWHPALTLWLRKINAAPAPQQLLLTYSFQYYMQYLKLVIQYEYFFQLNDC
jgi:hypothetical protein